MNSPVRPTPSSLVRRFAVAVLVLVVAVGAFAGQAGTTAECGNGPFNLEQALTDQAQRTTIAFGGLALVTGNLQAQSFFPPGKLVDYWGFQYLRDNDPSNMGHNTSFLTRVACNVIWTLDDGQLATLKALAESQVAGINAYGYKRYPLMKAFRRLLDGDLPAGGSGLDRAAVKAASKELYQLDGQLSFDRAATFASIYRSLSVSQKAYLDAMVGKGWSEWPDKDMDDVRDKMAGLPNDEAVAVMTYAGDIFAWYAGCVAADVYFCPERHGTYYGGFYIKDAPAIGHEGYSIDEQLTATAGSALCDASRGYVTAEQAALVSSLTDTQRNNLYAGTSNIVQARTDIATALRSLISPTAPSGAVLAQVLATVLEKSGEYGELDGENNYFYATVFRQLESSLSADQKARLMTLRQSILSGTYSDGTPFDFTTCSTYYLFSAPIADPSVLTPYVGNTDYLFGVTSTPTASFSFSPAAPAVGQTVQLTDTSTGSPTSWSWSFGDGATSSSQNPTHAWSTAGSYTVSLTVNNASGSNTTTRSVVVASSGSSFSLASDAGVDGGTLPAEYTCDGSGASPALSWSTVPAGTKELAVVMTTIPPDGATKYGWVLYRLPAGTTSIAKNGTGGGLLGVSHNGRMAYEPPCSQGPGPKLYTFTVYALSASPSLPSDPSQVTGEVLAQAIASITLGSASLDLTYTRPGTALMAAFSFAPALPAIGQVVQFTDGSTGTPTSWAWDFGDGSTSTLQNPTHAWGAAASYTVTLRVSNSSGTATVIRTVTVGTGGGSTCSGSNVYFVPAGAHATGAGGTGWVTDLAIQNAGSAAASLTLQLLERDQDNSIPASTTVAVDAAHQLSLEDLFFSKFGRESVAAALRICSDQPLRVMSRTYNRTATGTFGQGIPGVSATAAIAAGSAGHLLFLSEGAKFRTNLGLVNAGATPVAVDVELRDASGGLLGTKSLSLLPYEYVQRQQVFTEVTGSEVPLGSATIRPTGGAVFAYASVVDNATGDPTFMNAEK